MRSFALILTFISSLLIFTAALQGQDEPATQSATAEFKILTEVFLENSPAPVSTNETVFSNGLVFDLRFAASVTNPSEVSIYRPRQKSFVLLDYAKQQRAELDSLQLVRIVEGMKNEIATHEQLKTVFLDNFVGENDVENNQASINNNSLNYIAVGIRPESDLILTQYFQFLDQFTLFGATNPHAMPPFPRIRLNREIKKIGFVPTRIDLKMKPNAFRPAGMNAYSTHRIIPRLTESDRQRIGKIKQDWIAFKLVELPKYLQIDKIADAAAKPVSNIR